MIPPTLADLPAYLRAHPEAWLQRELFEDEDGLPTRIHARACRACAWGWICLITGGPAVSRAADDIVLRIAHYLGEAPRGAGHASVILIRWNDAPGRTSEDVAALFEAVQ